MKNIINDWIKASNSFDSNYYLSFYLNEAMLDDLSVGRKFMGHKGIGNYFDSYFINYNTSTEIMNVVILDESRANLEVKFTGDFPEGEIGGTFEITFKNNKISYLIADLIH